METDLNNNSIAPIADKRTEKRKIGDEGEELAAHWLLRRGYRIVARNYLCKCGELDIVAADDEKRLLAFIEVKSRDTLSYGLPCQAVSFKKQQRLKRSAELFLKNNSQFRACYQLRMDIIEILRIDGEIFIRHLKNAF